MLSKRDIFYSSGNSNYSYLKIDDLPYSFLVTDNVEKIIEDKRFLFFKRSKVIDFHLGRKLLPLNSMILYVLMNSVELKEYTYELDVESEKIPIYRTWDDFDVEDLKKGFIESVIKPVGISNYYFPHTLKSHTARGIAKDGYNFFCMEKNGDLHRSYWFVRTNKYGMLQLLELVESGPESGGIVTHMYDHIIDKQLATLLVENFYKGRLTQALSKKEKIEIEELKETD